MTAKLRKLPSRMETIAWIALIGFVGYHIWPQLSAATGVASANVPAPQIHLTTMMGAPVSTGSLRGDVVLVNFWATWCPPCRYEMPGFQAVYDRHHSEGFTVLGISTDGDPTLVNRYLAEHHITYPVAMASGAVVQAFGGLSVLPRSFLIDRNGRIRSEVTGLFAPIAVEQAVQRLLADSGPGRRQP